MSKIFLITGDRKGIGRQLAEHYLNLGNIVLGCSRNGSELKHKNYQHFICDVGEESSVKKMISQIRKKYKTIDVLINNAGMASMNHILTTPSETFDKLVSTNFKGTFLMLREGAKLMRKNGGNIINFSTVAAPLNLEGEAIYASTKSAVEKLTKITAHELAQYKIRVNAVGPTPIYTDLIKAVPKNKIQELISKQAIKRLGSFDDIKNIIDFYISEKSSFITAQTLFLGGV